jgi:hypothetical protein
MKKQKVWVVEYASGYTSETFVELFHSVDDAQARFITLVKVHYNESDDEPTLEAILNFINNGGKNISTDDTTITETSLSWDGYEVYESLEYYQQEIN